MLFLPPHLDPSCVLYLPFRELDGASFASKDKHGHLCTNYGSLWTPQGRKFDGIDDYVNAGNAATLDITNAITVELWLKYLANQTGERRILSKGFWKQDGYELWYNWSTTSLCFSVDNATTERAVTFVWTRDSNWHHVVGTALKDTFVKIYFDGLLKNTASGISWLSSTKNLGIGAQYNGLSPFNGYLDEVRIYNRVLTPQEIHHHCITGKEMFA